jgi:hypothetical protein
VGPPEIAPTDQTPIEAGLVADQNDSDAVAFEEREGFESILIKAYFLEALYIIRAIGIQYSVTVEEKEAAVSRSWRTKPYKHFGPVLQI